MTEDREKLCKDLRELSRTTHWRCGELAAKELERLAKELAKAHLLCGEMFKAAYDKERDAALAQSDAEPLDLGETTEWETRTDEGCVTCHTRVVDGVLCRWWGDGPVPTGVAKIDRAARSDAEPPLSEPSGEHRDHANKDR
jgi:hypothetical protein